MKHNWQYDESKHCGVDYANPEQVAIYDANHQKFRDYKKEAESIIAGLCLTKESVLIDMGCGTGALPLNAAASVKKIYAVDISKAMIDYARQKAKQAKLSNIEFHNAGILGYQHQGEQVDAVVCRAVLHHLPDFWKLIGLKNMAGMLKPKGKLHLFDVIHPGDITDYQEHIDKSILETTERVGPDFAEEWVITIRDEYPTYDWILEELLARAGFKLEEKYPAEKFGATYVCSVT